MNLTCSICAETIGSSDDLNVTSCGHMFHVGCLKQWLDRAKTCPQCRAVCTARNVVRLYLNVALNETVSEDPRTLQDSNDQLKLSVRELTAKQQRLATELKESNEKHQTSKVLVKKLIKEMEQKDLMMTAQLRIVSSSLCSSSVQFVI